MEKGFDGTEEEWLASLKGIAGEQGETGKSAFELAQENGFDGDLAAWLTSLHGEDGKDGKKGADGANGKSAFELYKESNPEYTGTLEEWLASLVGAKGDKGDKGDTGDTGADGKSAYELACGGGYIGTVQEWLVSLKGADGKSAYELAVENGYKGTETSWLASLKGEKGDTGAQGPQGEKGEKGDKGDTGEAGRGIDYMKIINGELWVFYTDGKSQNLGSVGGSSGQEEILIYVELSDGTYGVKAGEGAKDVAVIEIPDTYNGKAVTQIVDNAFSGLGNLNSVVIPEGIVNIGERAFLNCSSLTNIKLPSTLQSIQKYAFSNCININEITIPAATTYIGECAFYGCNLLSTATFEQPNNWVTSNAPSKISSNAIFLFSYNEKDSSGHTQTGDVYRWFNQEGIIAELLIGDSETSYMVGRDWKSKIVSLYKYAWYVVE